MVNLSRKFLLGTCALTGLLLLASPNHVFAQNTVPGLELGESIDLEADTLTYDRGGQTVIATGNVRIEHEGFVLVADQVIYNQDTGGVHATGHVQITDTDGNMLLLDEAELDDTLANGFIQNVRLIMNDGSRLVAAQGELHAGGRSSLDRVSYTPCALCAEHPEEEPIWQIRAVRVVHDEVEKRLYYEDAVLEMFGIPVLYLPYLSHPDPRVERASGLLVPEVRGTRGLGFSLAVPYLHVISPSADITFTPIFNAQANPVLDDEHVRPAGHRGLDPLVEGG